MKRIAFHTLLVFLLTILTQIGALAWLVALFFKRKLIAFFFCYFVLSIAAVWIAPLFGRVALSCFADGPLRVQSVMYCALNRNYVSPELREILNSTALEMNSRYPNTQTLVLDANFPFLDGFPLLPHLSHDDGEKADLAFYYADTNGYSPGATRSPIGYFAFEEGPTQCEASWPTLRWNFEFLQPLWKRFDLDLERNAAVLQILSANKAVGKIFVEPHLAEKLNVSHPNIRFQGCRAARHDDHIHFQLR